MKSTTFKTELTTVDGGIVYGAKNYLLDSWTESNFILFSPELKYPGQEIIFDLALGESSPNLSKKQRLRNIFVNKSTKRNNKLGIIFDARFDSNINIAHVIQNQIGMVLIGLDALNLTDQYGDVTFIMQSDAPNYIQELLTLLGFKYHLSTYGTFTGNILTCSSMIDLKSTVSQHLNQHIKKLGLISKASTPHTEKVFICRKGARSLINEVEISNLLEAYQYEKIFAEELSVLQQLNYIYGAKSLFFLHGAAMSFAMFRDSLHKGTMIEAFSSSFSTNWGRQICNQNGDKWFGCQGRITAKDLDVINGKVHPQKYQAKRFELDIEATELAIKEAESYLNSK
jgi:hypothetical protein